MSIPEVTIRRTSIEAAYVSADVPNEFKNSMVRVWDIMCDSDFCGEVDWSTSIIEADNMRSAHIKWHEDGEQE